MRSRFDEQLAAAEQGADRNGRAVRGGHRARGQGARRRQTRSWRKQVAPLDAEIDQKERDIESLCLKLLLQQQPVARDLRQISAALKMITDMERIGDQAEDIAEIITVSRRPQRRRMRAACAKWRAQPSRWSQKALTPSYKRDTMLAETVIADDDVVDDSFDEVKRRLIDNDRRTTRTTGEYALDLLMIAKYFERIGDHATNIAEWVIFSVTGVHKEEVSHDLVCGGRRQHPRH